MRVRSCLDLLSLVTLSYYRSRIWENVPRCCDLLSTTMCRKRGINYDLRDDSFNNNRNWIGCENVCDYYIYCFGWFGSSSFCKMFVLFNIFSEPFPLQVIYSLNVGELVRNIEYANYLLREKVKFCYSDKSSRYVTIYTR